MAGRIYRNRLGKPVDFGSPTSAARRRIRCIRWSCWPRSAPLSASIPRPLRLLQNLKGRGAARSRSPCLRVSVSSLPPSPPPSPSGRGSHVKQSSAWSGRGGHSSALRMDEELNAVLPRPEGEGWGEGEGHRKKQISRAFERGSIVHNHLKQPRERVKAKAVTKRRFVCSKLHPKPLFPFPNLPPTVGSEVNGFPDCWPPAWQVAFRNIVFAEESAHRIRKGKQ